MGHGSLGIWCVVWAPWAVIVAMDIAHEPRDWRWGISLLGLALLAGLTWGRFGEVEGRHVVVFAIGALLLLWGLVGSLRSHLRRKRMAAWAVKNGFTIESMRPDRAERTLPSALRGLPLLARARWPKTDFCSRDPATMVGNGASSTWSRP